MGISVKCNNTIMQLTSIATFPCMTCQVNLKKFSRQKCSKLENLPIFMLVEKNRHCFTNQKVAQKLKNVKNKKHHLRRNLISQTVMFFVFHISQLLSHFFISVTLELHIWQNLTTNCEEDLSFQWGGHHFIRILLILVYKDDDL